MDKSEKSENKVENKTTVSFINSEEMLSIVQLAEMQWRYYQQYLKISQNPSMAAEQTQITMNAMLQRRGGEQK